MTQDLRAIYRIGAVARLVGLTPGTIRTWEDRYGVISPRRSAGGRRLYSSADIEALRFVKTKVDAGIQPADAHRLLAEHTGDGSERREPTKQAGVRPLILLIDRDPYAADGNEYFLRREGYDVDVATDLPEAERKFSALAPRLAIVELLVSGGEGFDLCRRLKEQGAARVLAVSPLDAGRSALAAGADAFLQKPIDPVVLVTAVNDLVRSSDIVEADAELRT
jgi:DNA-binding transcriptional MerR regulator